MNRLLVTLVAIASLGLAATAARADSNRKTCGANANCEHNVEFSGAVTPSCECESTNGSLPTMSLTNTLSSANTADGGKRGSFTARCNTTTASVKYSMTYTPPTGQASTAKYSVDGPNTSDDVLPAQSADATRTWPNFISQTALISAQVDAPTGQVLLANPSYKVVVKATLTP
jgi:hypothetical protein